VFGLSGKIIMRNKWVKIILFLMPFILLSGCFITGAKTDPLWQDEYVFYRITQELPNTSTSDTWFWVDNPKTTYNSEQWDSSIDRHDVFARIYNTPIYVHSPIWNYIAYPFVKFADWLADKGVIKHIEEDQSKVQSAETMTIGLRIIPIVLFIITMWFVFLILWRKVDWYAYFYFIPMLASSVVLTVVPYFYWDMFMWLLVVLTLYFQEKNSKWAYLTGCLLVNTKIAIGLLLLIPFIIKNKKMVLCALSLIPFYLATVFVTHDIFWIFTHLGGTTGAYSWLYSFWDNSMIRIFGLPFYAICTLPIFYYFKKYPVYCSLLIITIIYGWGLGITPTKMTGMLIIGGLACSLFLYELNLKRVVHWIMN
jgi:hypothetical protein